MLSTAYAKAPTDVEAFTARADPGGVTLVAIQTAWTFPEKALVTKTLNTSVPKTSLNVIPCLYQATMSLHWFPFLTTWIYRGMDFFFFRGESFYSDECANKYGNFSSNVTLLKRYLKLVPLDKSNTTAKILIIRCLFWWMMIRYVNRRHDRMYRVNGTGTTIVKLMNRSLKQNK